MDKIRLTIDLLPERHEALQRLQDLTGSSSKADVVRRALLIFEFLHKETARGANLYVEKDGNRERVVILGG